MQTAALKKATLEAIKAKAEAQEQAMASKAEKEELDYVK